MEIAEKERVSVEDAAALLGCNPQSVREHMKRGLWDTADSSSEEILVSHLQAQVVQALGEGVEDGTDESSESRSLYNRWEIDAGSNL